MTRKVRADGTEMVEGRGAPRRPTRPERRAPDALGSNEHYISPLSDDYKGSPADDVQTCGRLGTPRSVAEVSLAIADQRRDDRIFDRSTIGRKRALQSKEEKGKERRTARDGREEEEMVHVAIDRKNEGGSKWGSCFNGTREREGEGE